MKHVLGTEGNLNPIGQTAPSVQAGGWSHKVLVTGTIYGLAQKASQQKMLIEFFWSIVDWNWVQNWMGAYLILNHSPHRFWPIFSPHRNPYLTLWKFLVVVSDYYLYDFVNWNNCWMDRVLRMTLVQSIFAMQGRFEKVDITKGVPSLRMTLSIFVTNICNAPRPIWKGGHYKGGSQPAALPSAGSISPQPKPSILTEPPTISILWSLPPNLNPSIAKLDN